MHTVDDKMKTGFDKFLNCLNLYLELLNYPAIDKSRVNIYESVTLENGAIMRATNNYHNRPWFSNVAVSMNFEESDDYISDQGICYGLVTINDLHVQLLIASIYYLYYLQTLLLAEILIGSEYPPLNLALVQWYDFKSAINPYKYGCPHMKLTEIYNFVSIEAIRDIVHVILHFGKSNEYFVNKYI